MATSHMRRIIPALFSALVLVLALMPAGRAGAAGLTDNAAPVPGTTDTASENWEAAVREAVPAHYLTNGRLNYAALTNVFYQESARGNIKAQALWGLTLTVQSHTREQTDAGIQLMRDSADKGWVPAMLLLSALYERGQFVRKNYNESFHWNKLAAEAGSAEGEFRMGIAYRYGLGTTPDLKQAVRCYLTASERTNYVAMQSLGYMLMNGLGVETNVAEAKHWFTRAAVEGGNRRAMYDLGVLCSLNQADTNAAAEAFQWYGKSAERDDDLGCLQVALGYLNGIGVETNIYSYRYWLMKAAFAGSTEAQYRVGAAYRTGQGLPLDPESSLVWYKKAAAKNHPAALYDLAGYYWRDKTDTNAAALADGYLLRAAQMGHRAAQFLLAEKYFTDANDTGNFAAGQTWLERAATNGWPPAEFLLYEVNYAGVAPATNCPAYPQDKTQAIQWLRKAAADGNLQAQSVLAVMLIRGKDVPPDTAEAERLLRFCAEHGYAAAQNDLGFSILEGDIDSADPTEAAMWCQLAVWGNTTPDLERRARVNLERALLRLTDEQRREAKRRATEFRPLPPIQVDPLMKGWQNNPAYMQEGSPTGR